jgi:hypothetical protein
MGTARLSSGRVAGFRRITTAVVVLSGFLVGARASADTVFIEAEGTDNISNDEAKISSPFLIKEDPAASVGRYLTVAAGFNSQSAPPGAEGMATYHFNLGTGGTYRVWARVIAPSPNDDSFWVRMDKAGTPGSRLVRWNDIPAGNNWHWVLVVNDGETAPTQFNLIEGDHDLQVSYREDGAKLDVLVITNDTTFNPSSPPTTAPPISGDTAIFLPTIVTGGAKSGIRVLWSEVPGARSYTVRSVFDDGSGNERRVPLASGLTTHLFTDATASGEGAAGCYDVIAIFPDGTFRERPFARCESAEVRQSFVGLSGAFTATLPMAFSGEGGDAGAVPGFPDSLNAPPAHGRLRVDFLVGGTASSKVQLWVQPMIPTANPKDHDSIWARMDDGAWIKWNNMVAFCAPVSNSDAGGARVTFTVTPGMHRFEFAPREGGLRLDTLFFITEDLNAGSRICDD